jgi:hypothetical protein
MRCIESETDRQWASPKTTLSIRRQAYCPPHHRVFLLFLSCAQPRHSTATLNVLAFVQLCALRLARQSRSAHHPPIHPPPELFTRTTHPSTHRQSSSRAPPTHPPTTRALHAHATIKTKNKSKRKTLIVSASRSELYSGGRGAGRGWGSSKLGAVQRR